MRDSVSELYIGYSFLISFYDEPRFHFLPRKIVLTGNRFAVQLLGFRSERSVPTGGQQCQSTRSSE